MLENILKEKKRIWARTHNKNRTKREIYQSIFDYKRDNKDILLIEANKRRVNITINQGVLDLIEKRYSNRSDLIEKYLISVLEKELNKKIEISKYKGNYEKY